MKNVRFLIYWNNAWVKITLKPEQSLSCYTGANDEEGYHSNYMQLKYEYENVFLTEESNSIDCDGPHSDFREYVCHVDKLSSYKNYYGTMIPEWKEISANQRDYYAEAMGY